MVPVSPTGSKVIDAMYAGGDFSEVIDAMDKGSGSMKAADVEKMNTSAAAQLPYKFDADDWKAVEAGLREATDPLAGARAGDYDALFRRIVTLAPPPIGVGPAARPG